MIPRSAKFEMMQTTMHQKTGEVKALLKTVGDKINGQGDKLERLQTHQLRLHALAVAVDGRAGVRGDRVGAVPAGVRPALLPARRRRGAAAAPAASYYYAG